MQQCVQLVCKIDFQWNQHQELLKNNYLVLDAALEFLYALRQQYLFKEKQESHQLLIHYKEKIH